MLATSSTGSSNRRPVRIEELVGTHVFDLKIDGVRAMLHRDLGNVRLVNRNGVDITHKYPEIASTITGDDGLVLDGEIVAEDGSFETTLLRDQQEKKAAITRLSRLHPCRFVVFDTPARMHTWTTRRAQIEADVERAFAGNDRVTLTPYSDDPAFFTQVAEMGMEGVIAKRKTSRYQPGKRSVDWVKFKTVRRVSALISGYSPGSGSRSHFGAIHLAMLDDNHNPVDVGRCGSGFTEHQTHELKERLDAGQILVVEIEALNLTSGGKLRHPVYRGIRSDLSPLDATIDQLATLPTC